MHLTKNLDNINKIHVLVKMIILALIYLRYHSVTFEAFFAILIDNVWNKYLSACYSVTA